MSEEQSVVEVDIELETFDTIWNEVIAKLAEQRELKVEKRKEIDEQTATCTRVDLAEYNEAHLMVNKLEAAVEVLDLVRTRCLGLESAINYTE